MMVERVQVTEEIGIYLDRLREAHPAVDEVWLVGARAAEPGRRGAPWELLLFADAATLEALRLDRRRHRADVALLVVTDGDVFESASGGEREGRLTDLGWRRDDPNTASYSTEGARRPAVRLR